MLEMNPPCNLGVICGGLPPYFESALAYQAVNPKPSRHVPGTYKHYCKLNAGLGILEMDPLCNLDVICGGLPPYFEWALACQARNPKPWRHVQGT